MFNEEWHAECVPMQLLLVAFLLCTPPLPALGESSGPNLRVSHIARQHALPCLWNDAVPRCQCPALKLRSRLAFSCLCLEPGSSSLMLNCECFAYEAFVLLLARSVCLFSPALTEKQI